VETTAGRRAERKAQAFLELQGLVTVTNNYHCAMGEIDIIMLHNNTLVFVEVGFDDQVGLAAQSTALPGQNNKRSDAPQNIFEKNTQILPHSPAVLILSLSTIKIRNRQNPTGCHRPFKCDNLRQFG